MEAQDYRSDAEMIYRSDAEMMYRSDTEMIHGSDAEMMYRSDTEMIHGSEQMNKLTEIPCKKELKKERNRARWHRYYGKLSPEKKEERKLKQREYYKKLCLKENKEKRRYEHYNEKQIREETEWNRVQMHELYKPLSFKKAVGTGGKKYKSHKGTRTKTQIEKNRERMRDYYRMLSPEKKEQRRLKMIEYKSKIKTPEWIEENREKHRQYYRKLKAKKIKENEQRISGCETLVTEQKEHNLEYCEGNLNTSMNVENDSIIQGFNRDTTQQVFCYTCRIAFLNNSALLEHIAEHVTLPSVILSRMDKRIKDSSAIKKESDNMHMNSDLYSSVMPNVIRIKPERVEYNEDVDYEWNNPHVNIKTENEIEVDDASFYTNVKTEIEDN